MKINHRTLPAANAFKGVPKLVAMANVDKTLASDDVKECDFTLKLFFIFPSNPKVKFKLIKRTK